jgi:3-methylcrotonyl-CoA carboxylase alpha subunit
MITGLDLVEWQLEVSLAYSSGVVQLPHRFQQVAAGNPLPLTQSSIPLVGHAFEARIYAENPREGFLPASGTLLHLSTPTPTHVFAPSVPARSSSSAATALTPEIVPAQSAPTVRLEQGVSQGSQVGVFYDPMIAKLVVHGRDRTEALRALRKALEEYQVVGINTNVEFLRTLAGHWAFIEGDVETGFIKVRMDALYHVEHLLTINLETL